MVPNPAVPASNNLNVRPNALALPLPSSSYPNTVYSASTTATGNSTAGSAALDVIDVSNLQSMQGVERVTVSRRGYISRFRLR